MAERFYDLTELIALMKANKIQHLKMGAMELDMHPAAFEPEAVAASEDAPADLPGEFTRMPSPEEFQFMSGVTFAPVEPPAAEEVSDG